MKVQDEMFFFFLNICQLKTNSPHWLFVSVSEKKSGSNVRENSLSVFISSELRLNSASLCVRSGWSRRPAPSAALVWWRGWTGLLIRFTSRRVAVRHSGGTFWLSRWPSGSCAASRPIQEEPWRTLSSFSSQLYLYVIHNMAFPHCMNIFIYIFLNVWRQVWHWKLILFFVVFSVSSLLPV